MELYLTHFLLYLRLTVLSLEHCIHKIWILPQYLDTNHWALTPQKVICQTNFFRTVSEYSLFCLDFHTQ